MRTTSDERGGSAGAVTAEGSAGHCTGGRRRNLHHLARRAIPRDTMDRRTPGRRRGVSGCALVGGGRRANPRVAADALGGIAGRCDLAGGSARSRRRRRWQRAASGGASRSQGPATAGATWSRLPRSPGAERPRRRSRGRSHPHAAVGPRGRPRTRVGAGRPGCPGRLDTGRARRPAARAPARVHERARPHRRPRLGVRPGRRRPDPRRSVRPARATRARARRRDAGSARWPCADCSGRPAPFRPWSATRPLPSRGDTLDSGQVRSAASAIPGWALARAHACRAPRSPDPRAAGERARCRESQRRPSRDRRASG